MRKEVILVSLLILFLSGISIVNASNFDIFYSGGLSVRLEEKYNAGDEISSQVYIYNNEEFPIVNASLIAEVVYGCEYPTYPAQESDCDNIVDEVVISEIYIPSQESVFVPFEYKLPEDFKAGIYRVDFFLRTLKTPIVGMNHIHMGGMNSHFEFEGVGNFPSAKILRTKTHINEYYGPVGAPVQSGENGILEVYVESDNSFNGVLKMSIFNWQDSLGEPLFVGEKNVQINPGEQKIDLDFISPENPDAYSVRIELLENGRIVSLFRSRLIVQGETAKIRKVQTDKYYYDNEPAKISLLLGGSPDHYGWTRTPKTIVEVSIKNNLNGNEYKDSLTIEEFTLEDFFKIKNFEFNIKEKMSNFRVCTRTISAINQKTYDEHCYDVDASLFPVNKHLIELKELYEGKMFKGRVCTKNPITKNEIEANLEILVTDMNKVVKQFRGFGSCVDLSFEMISGEEYLITVNNLDTHQTEVFEVRLKREFFDSFIIWILISLIIAFFIIYLSIKLLKNRGGNL